MSFEYHDYKATIYREPYKDKDTIQRWVLSYTSKSSKERYSLVLEAEDYDQAKEEAATLLDIDSRLISCS